MRKTGEDLQDNAVSDILDLVVLHGENWSVIYCLGKVKITKRNYKPISVEDNFLKIIICCTFARYFSLNEDIPEITYNRNCHCVDRRLQWVRESP